MSNDSIVLIQVGRAIPWELTKGIMSDAFQMDETCKHVD